MPASASSPCEPRPGRGVWHWCRRGFKWCGHGSWILAVLLGYTAIHLNQIGLPEFLKQPLLDQLRERGVELDFSRMRLRLTRGIVAENVNVSRGRDQAGEIVYAEELQLKLRWADLLSLQRPALVAVTVEGGRLTVPLQGDAGESPYPLTVDNVAARLWLDVPEQWNLEWLRADCLGGAIEAAGVVTNATWSRRRGTTNAPAVSRGLRRQLLRGLRELDQLVLDAPPRLNVSFFADLAEPTRSSGRVTLEVDGARSGLGSFSGVSLTAEAGAEAGQPDWLRTKLTLAATAAEAGKVRLGPLQLHATAVSAPTNALPQRLEWRLTAEGGETPWGQARQVRLSGLTSHQDQSAGEFSTEAEVNLEQAGSPWGSLNRLSLKTTARHRLEGRPTNWIPTRALLSLEGSGIKTPWAGVGRVGLEGEVRRAVVTNEVLPAWWRWLEPWELSARLETSVVTVTNTAVDELRMAVGWSNGVVVLHDLAARLYGGVARGDAQLDVATRQASATVSSRFDLHRLEPLMTPEAVKWIRQYGWRPEAPPDLRAMGRAVLPAWTNRQPDWRGDVLPTLRVAGVARATNFAFREIPGSWAVVPFAHTNLVWSVQQGRAARPEGEVEFDYEGHTRTKDYHFRVRGALDPAALRPVLEEKGRQALERMSFPTPPHVEGEIWGRWQRQDLIGATARVAATNFVFRGEAVSELRGDVAFTNQFFNLRDVELWQGDRWGRVPAAGFDVPTRVLYLTNAQATLDVASVTRAIGPRTHATMEAFRFVPPLQATVNGRIHTREEEREHTDLTFDGRLAGFHWWRFNATNTAAHVHWQGDHITVTNLAAGFHGGHITGEVRVDVANREDAVFAFNAEGRDLNLQTLLHDLLPQATNRLEGTLSGRLLVTEAHSRTNGPWTGRGSARLRDGFLWDLPLFGLLSPLFEGISPGLGRSRFSEGTATFTITNRTITSRDLELRSPTMRLQFRGDVDFDGRLDTRMEAELLRDVPLVGPVVSFVLSPFTKLFELDVRGTLGQPETDLRYVPSFLLAPLRPFRTLRELFTEEPAKKPVPTPPPEPRETP